MKRKIMLVAGGLVVGVIGLIGAALLLVDADSFRPTIQAELQKQLRRPVTLGKVGVSLWPLGVRVDDVVVGERLEVRGAARPFIKMQSLQVRAGLLALLRREVRVDSLILHKPEIELVEAVSGNDWNFSDLARSSTGDSSGNTGSFQLAELRIHDGTVGVTRAGKRSVFEGVGVSLQDIAAGARTRVDAAVQVPGSGAEALSFKGKLNPLEGKLGAKDVSVAGLARAAGAATTALDGLLTGNVDVTPTAAAGKLELQKGSVGGKPLKAPAVLDFALAIAGDRVDVQKLLLSSGKLAASATGWMDTAKSTVDLRARMADTSLGELLSFAGLDGSGTVSVDLTARGPLAGDLQLGGGGTVRDAELRDASLRTPLRVRSAGFTFDRNDVRLQNVDAAFAGSIVKGSLTAKGIRGNVPDLDFDIEADKLDAAEWQNAFAPTPASPNTSAAPKLRGRGTVRIGHLLAQGLVLDNARAQAELDGGVLRLDPVTADLFGGKETGSIVVDTRAKVPTLTMKTRLENVDANKLLSATTSVKQILNGLLLAGGNATMSLASNPQEIARSLNGALNLKLTKGTLAGTHLLNQLSAIGKFTGLPSASQPFTNIVLLDGDLNITNGIAKTDNLRMQIEGATLTMAGLVNLVDQGLNLKVTAVLDRDTSRKVGGTGIGGYLNTVLANPQGELVIPALVTGTIGQPRFTPDGVRMAEMKARGILGALTGSKPGEPAQPAKQVIRGLIDAFRRPK